MALCFKIKRHGHTLLVGPDYPLFPRSRPPLAHHNLRKSPSPMAAMKLGQYKNVFFCGWEVDLTCVLCACIVELIHIDIADLFFLPDSPACRIQQMLSKPAYQYPDIS